jgi:hypothetical protein
MYSLQRLACQSIDEEIHMESKYLETRWQVSTHKGQQKGSELFFFGVDCKLIVTPNHKKVMFFGETLLLSL